MGCVSYVSTTIQQQGHNRAGFWVQGPLNIRYVDPLGMGSDHPKLGSGSSSRAAGSGCSKSYQKRFSGYHMPKGILWSTCQRGSDGLLVHYGPLILNPYEPIIAKHKPPTKERPVLQILLETVRVHTRCP